MRNGSGQYNLPNGTWTSSAANGSLATLADFQSLINDVANALTQSISKDGQTPITGNLAMGGNKLTGLGAGTATGQTLSWEQLFAQGTETDVASAATCDIGLQNSNFLRITGTTTIASFGTNYRGPRYLRFAGAVTLTNSSTLILPGGANFTTTAGDVLVAIPKATGGTADGWYIVSLPTSLAGYVTLSGTQTLTNKTIDGASNTITNLPTTALANNAVTSGKMSTTGVTAASYTAANITVDAAGRITSASNGAASGGMTLLATITPSSGVSSVSITGLASSKQFVIAVAGVGLATSSWFAVALSSNNGGSYGALKQITPGNSPTHNIACDVFNTNITAIKVIRPLDGSGSILGIVTEASITGVINALQFQCGANFSGTGNIYVYGIN
jgi:hypothetical protein